jgi:WD40 repeat protein
VGSRDRRTSRGYRLWQAIVWMSPDTDSFITVGRNGSVRVWDVKEEGDK